MRPLEASERGQAGAYRLLAELGRGGMGRVCLAAGPDGRLVAVKLIGEQVRADDGFRARFRREVEASRRVSGAHTAAVLDADPDADPPWLASVFVPGPSLSEAMRATGPLPEPAVRRLAAGLASALVSIHAAGVVHRDLNPSNVLLTDDGVRVVDFGIAQTADGIGTGTGTGELTRPGMLVGTAGYLSPEQIRGEPTGPAADVFAFGCVVALAGTGRQLFTGDTVPQLLHQILHAEPDLAGLPEPVRRLVGPCLDKDPARRPTPAEVVAFIGDVEPSARPWPPGVPELIDRQRAEIGHLLPGGGHPTVAVPTLPGPVFPRGVATVGPDAPPPPHDGPHEAPPVRRSRLRLVFWLCAGATAVVLLGAVGIGVGWALATTGRTPDRAGGHPTTGPTSSSPSPTPSPSPTLPVTGALHGYRGVCLDVHDADSANRTPVQIYRCNGTNAQQWTYGTDGTLRSLDKCLDVTDGNTVNGAKVQVYDCNGTGAQQWTLRDGQVINTPSGRCLDDTGWSTEDGTQAQIWDCGGGANQQWQLTP
ncbi:MAG TPA: ricin-type beta-trefoil lectin domain protein [Actinocatenispora sp.]